MKPTFITSEVLVVELPENAANFVPGDIYVNLGYLVFKVFEKEKKWLHHERLPGVELPGMDYHDRKNDGVFLPPGYTYELIGTDLSEEQAAQLVEQHQVTRLGLYGWKDYEKSNEKTTHFTCLTALESLRSLEESKGITATNKIYLKTKKV